MANLKQARVVDLNRLSSVLCTFELMPDDGSRFPDYRAGQYIALRRSRCRLTRPVTEPDGRRRYVPDIDEAGNPRLGPVTHSYSIASAPCETREKGRLGFYVVVEKDAWGTEGRLSSALFQLQPDGETVEYVERITGAFTLDRRASGFGSVLLVGSGTGLAPFVSMIKQLDNDARAGRIDRVKYTLIHTNRTYEELAYHQELLDIEAAGRFDFAYLPTVSRPTARDLDDRRLGCGRANNVLRHIFDMPLKEEQDLQETRARGEDASAARLALGKAVVPVLPRHVSKHDLQKRLSRQSTVVLTCGNPSSMADIQYAAETWGIPFEKEDW